jgi:hypothetical protein
MVLLLGRTSLIKFSQESKVGGTLAQPAGKTVLLKSVLSSLSIFQCSGLLSPKGTLEKISKALYEVSFGPVGKLIQKSFIFLIGSMFSNLSIKEV